MEAFYRLIDTFFFTFVSLFFLADTIFVFVLLSDVRITAFLFSLDVRRLVFVAFLDFMSFEIPFEFVKIFNLSVFAFLKRMIYFVSNVFFKIQISVNFRTFFIVFLSDDFNNKVHLKF